MSRLLIVLTVVAAGVLVPWAECHAAEPKLPMRGVLVGIDRVSPEFLAAWKAKGVSAVVVPLDDATKRRWKPMAEAVERAGMTIWPWIEVARNPAMADAHPEWMAAIGGHHDDWRRRFPNAPAAVPECAGGEKRRGHQGLAVGSDRLCASVRRPSATAEIAAWRPSGKVGGCVLERPSGRSVVVRVRQRPVPLGTRLRIACDGGPDARRRCRGEHRRRACGRPSRQSRHPGVGDGM